MAKASWTYEVPGAGTGSVALEEYVVEEASGEPVGKVVTVLERRGDLYVVVERGTPPLTHDLRAVPWDDIERVDHSALTVRLGLAKEAIEETLELDPKKGVKAEDAEAHRVTELPGNFAPALHQMRRGQLTVRSTRSSSARSHSVFSHFSLSSSSLPEWTSRGTSPSLRSRLSCFSSRS